MLTEASPQQATVEERATGTPSESEAVRTKPGERDLPGSLSRSLEMFVTLAVLSRYASEHGDFLPNIAAFLKGLSPLFDLWVDVRGINRPGDAGHVGTCLAGTV